MGGLSQCFKANPDADKYREKPDLPPIQTKGIPLLSDEVINALSVVSPNEFILAQEKLLGLYKDYNPTRTFEAKERLFTIEWHLNRAYAAGKVVTVTDQNLEAIASLSGHNRPVKSMSIFSNRLVTGSADYSLKLWDLTTYAEVNSQNINWNVVTAIKQFPDTETIAHCSEDLRLRVWDTRSGALVKVAEWMAGENIANTCDTADPYIITGHRGFNSKGSELKLWDTRKRELVISAETHLEPVVKVIHHNSRIFSCGKDGLLAQSDLRTLAVDNSWQHPLAKPFVTMTMLEENLLTANIEPRLQQFGTHPQLLLNLC